MTTKSPTAYTRRWHAKSKTGCIKCKASRIKCGEESPICHNCSQSGSACSLQDKNAPETQPSDVTRRFEKTANNKAWHPKSRLGCARCKNRRMKCEEKAPCANCIRRHSDCQYVSSEQQPNQSIMLSNPALSFKLAPNFASERRECMEIFHHYMTKISESLASGQAIPTRYYCLEVPRLAFADDTCMDALIAYSALHYAKLVSVGPNKSRLVAIARKYHHMALQRSQSPIESSQRDVALGRALSYCFTGFTVLAWRQLDPSDLIDDALCTLISVARLWTGKVMLEAEFGFDYYQKVRRWVADQHHGDSCGVHKQLSDFVENLNGIRRLVQETAIDKPQRTDLRLSLLPNDHVDLYMETLAKLEQCFTEFVLSGVTKSVYAWLHEINRSFLTHLQMKSAIACAIAFCYGTLLDLLKDDWHAIGFGRELVLHLSVEIDYEGSSFSSLVAWGLSNISAPIS